MCLELCVEGFSGNLVLFFEWHFFFSEGANQMAAVNPVILLAIRPPGLAKVQDGGRARGDRMSPTRLGCDH
jgi:hypothetical protein